MAEKKTITGQPEETGGNTSKGSDVPQVGASRKLTQKRERFMTLLRVQFGYTNEKSIDEMERLLKQFSSTNKSLQIKHVRRKLSPPFLE